MNWKYKIKKNYFCELNMLDFTGHNMTSTWISFFPNILYNIQLTDHENHLKLRMVLLNETLEK